MSYRVELVGGMHDGRIVEVLSLASEIRIPVATHEGWAYDCYRVRADLRHADLVGSCLR